MFGLTAKGKKKKNKDAPLLFWLYSGTQGLILSMSLGITSDGAWVTLQGAGDENLFTTLKVIALPTVFLLCPHPPNKILLKRKLKEIKMQKMMKGTLFYFCLGPTNNCAQNLLLALCSEMIPGSSLDHMVWGTQDLNPGWPHKKEKFTLLHQELYFEVMTFLELSDILWWETEITQ